MKCSCLVKVRRFTRNCTSLQTCEPPSLKALSSTLFNIIFCESNSGRGMSGPSRRPREGWARLDLILHCKKRMFPRHAGLGPEMVQHVSFTAVGTSSGQHSQAPRSHLCFPAGRPTGAGIRWRASAYCASAALWELPSQGTWETSAFLFIYLYST